MEYIELSKPFIGADKSEVTAVDICEPKGKGKSYGILCANLAGYVNKSQMDASIAVGEKMGGLSDAIEAAKAEKEAEAEPTLLEKAKGLVQICTLGNYEFGGELIAKFDAIWTQDKQILQRDGKPLSDFDYKELHFRDRVIIAAAFALNFMES